MPPSLHIDFETASTADLKAVGAANYAEHPSTRIVCVAHTTPWDASNPRAVVVSHVPPGTRWSPPVALLQWVADGEPIRAWNASFEYHVWRNQVGGLAAKPDWDQIHDTMAKAAYWGLPLSLDMASQALPELGIVKDKIGHAIMLRMSRPRKVRPGGAIDWWDDDPDKLQALLDYCAQDVRTEMAIDEYLPDLPDRERKIWLMDARANERGLPYDKALGDKMKAVAGQEIARLDKLMAEATGGAVPNTRAAKQLAEWAVAQGLAEASGGVAKDLLPGLISRADTSGLFNVSEAMAIRQEAAKSSVAKLTAMENWAGNTRGVMRGLVQYYGAFRTGRWAGRGPQIQNYPRSLVKDQEGLVKFLRGGGDAEGLEMFFGVTPLTALSSALRGCVWVPAGQGHFAAVDFSQIEARVLAWLAGETLVLDAFRSGKDLYRVAASVIFGVSYDAVSGDQRQLGKVATLALGYAGGAGAFLTMGKNYGLVLPEEEAEQIKLDWRAGHPRIVNFWYALERAAYDAVSNPGDRIDVGVGITFAMWRGHLLCRLPSGRVLCYREAQTGTSRFGTGNVSYMGVDQYTKKWTRIETYGGKLAENITQAVARDVMADALLRVEEQLPGLVEVLGSVHDEGLFRVKKSGAYEPLVYWMKKAPEWAPGLPVDADGYIGRRFKKG